MAPSKAAKGAARVPECPYALAERGSVWWTWAWGTSQAEKWDPGALFTVARRARLEDDLAALNFDADLDVGDLFADGNVEALRRVEWALSALRRSATGMVALSKEMRELETQLGLGPKASAGLGWTQEVVEENDRLDELNARREKRLRAAGAKT